jgi:hypothetical protein
MSIDMVQRFIVEVDSAKLLEQYLRLAMTTVLNSHEELAVKVVDRNEKYLSLHLPSVFMDQDKHFPVVFVGGWYLPKAPKGGGKNSYFNGYGPWATFRFDGTTSAVDAAVQHIKQLFKENEKTWIAQFKQKFGDGYNDFFNHFDGSIGTGYELRACGCFPEWLAISLVHMYYGK